MTINSGFHQGQIGAKIILDTLDDSDLLESAIVKEIWYKNTSGSGKFSAEVNGSTLSYTTTSTTDLPVSGIYQLQAHAEGTGWSIYGDIVSTQVSVNVI
jgi:hypothetical protein